MILRRVYKYKTQMVLKNEGVLEKNTTILEEAFFGKIHVFSSLKILKNIAF